MADLAALDAANAALQKDPKAAKTVKAYAAEATKAMHALQPPAPTPVYGALPPVGPFMDLTWAKWFRTTAGGNVSKIRVHDTPDYGVGLMGYFNDPNPGDVPKPSTGTWYVTDVIGERIGSTPPAMNGTGEAGLWFGQRVLVDRARGDGTWMGAWTGCQCCDSVIRNLTCAKADGSRLPNVGLYIEHATRRVLIDGLTVRSESNGVNVEWWYADASYAPFVAAELPAAPAGEAGSWSVEIRNFDIDSGAWGMFLDAGTCGFRIHDGILRGLNGIAHPKNLAVPTMPNVIDWPTIDFRGSGQRELIHGNAIG